MTSIIIVIFTPRSFHAVLSMQRKGPRCCRDGGMNMIRVVTYAYNLHAVRTHHSDRTASYSSRTHDIYDTYAFIILRFHNYSLGI